MNKGTRLLACLAAALAARAAALAQIPVREMDARSMSLGYTFGMRGQDITDAAVASNDVSHRVTLGYAPVPYVSLHAGMGLDRLSVEPYGRASFDGEYGFSPSFGAALHSPAFAADILRATGGADLQSIRSEDGRGYRYSAVVTNPFLGLVASPTVFLDVALGGRLHFVDGIMEGPRSGEQAFANTEIARAYLSLTVKSPWERAFLHLDADLSPSVEGDWAAGPREAAFSVTVGGVLGWKGKSARPKDAPAPGKPTYFPAYPEMKDRQDKMAEELE